MNPSKNRSSSLPLDGSRAGGTRAGTSVNSFACKWERRGSGSGVYASSKPRASRGRDGDSANVRASERIRERGRAHGGDDSHNVEGATGPARHKCFRAACVSRRRSDLSDGTAIERRWSPLCVLCRAGRSHISGGSIGRSHNRVARPAGPVARVRTRGGFRYRARCRSPEEPPYDAGRNDRSRRRSACGHSADRLEHGRVRGGIAIDQPAG